MGESTQNRWKNQNIRTPSRRVANPSGTECPDFLKFPEIRVKMIRRVNDEEGGIKKLFMEVFQAMWFSPAREKPLLEFLALMSP